MSEKKLYRSHSKKIIGGICGGFSEFFSIDVTIIRLIWAAAVFLGGTGLLFYVICWIIIPEEPFYRIS